MSDGRPLVLAIMDGWGVASPWGGNATTVAKTPVISSYWQKMPKVMLGAAEAAVGLPKGERGNSEVGHLNIGCGQVVHQDLPSISGMIKDGSFYDNEVLKGAMGLVKENGKQLHLIGLTSDGGVHSHISHLLALIEMAKRMEVPRMFIHAMTDGRDTAPMEALKFIQLIEKALDGMPRASIATICGRYFAMDRDGRWERVEKAYRALVEGIGNEAISAKTAVSDAYKNGQSDEFISPTIVRAADHTVKSIKDGDVIIFFNFRADRARELTQALVAEKFEGFRRDVVRKGLTFVTLTSYQEGMPVKVAFAPREVHSPIGKVFSDAGWKQLRIAETEKYAHVTYFFNGGREKPFPGEDHLLVPSPKLLTYDQKPEMSAPQVTQGVLDGLPHYDFILVNFANPDMVGHTGAMRPAVQAVETVDRCIGVIAKAVLSLRGTLIVTADHGNVEQMVNPSTGYPDTEHTTNPVPFFVVSSGETIRLRPDGVLADIAPTLLDYCHLAIPSEMTGKSLIVK